MDITKDLNKIKESLICKSQCRKDRKKLLKINNRTEQHLLVVQHFFEWCRKLRRSKALTAVTRIIIFSQVTRCMLQESKKEI